MADTVVNKESKQPVPHVTVESIYETLSYADQLIVHAQYKNNLQQLVDKTTFLSKLANEKSKEVK